MNNGQYPHPVADARLPKDRGPKRKRSSEDVNPRKNKEPRLHNRLIRRVQIRTDTGVKYANALFDTGANIFMMDSKTATKFNLRQIQRSTPLEILSYSGIPSPTSGRSYAPFVRLIIDKHETFIACEIGTLEPGINLIIPGGWFLNDHPMSFDRGKIQIQTHSCCEDDAFEWDNEEEGLDDPNAVLV